MSAKFPRGGGAGPFLARSLNNAFLVSIGLDMVLSSLYCKDILAILSDHRGILR